MTIHALLLLLGTGLDPAPPPGDQLLCRAANLDKESCIDNSIPEEEMSTIRGGYGGIAFSFLIEGSLTPSGANGGLPDGIDITQQTDNMVQLTGGLGSFGDAAGLFQLTNVAGDNNVVSSNFTINIAIVNGTAPDPLGALTAAFGQ